MFPVPMARPLEQTTRKGKGGRNRYTSSRPRGGLVGLALQLLSPSGTAGSGPNAQENSGPWFLIAVFKCFGVHLRS